MREDHPELFLRKSNIVNTNYCPVVEGFDPFVPVVSDERNRFFIPY